MIAGAGRSDAGLSGCDPRRTLAADFERLAILQRRLGAIDPAIGRRSRNILGEHANRRIGSGARLAC